MNGWIQLYVVISLSCLIFGSASGDSKLRNILSCRYKGETYYSGQTFNVECNSCTCHSGRISCTQKHCPTNTDGSCFYKGEFHKDNSGFHDDCNWCFCTRGYMDCTKKVCPEKGGCSHEGVVHKNGDFFKDECNMCRCIHGKVGCSQKDCSNGKTAGGYISDQGKPEQVVLGTCEHNGHVYPHGARFMIECNQCTCFKGVSACTSKYCGV